MARAKRRSCAMIACALCVMSLGAWAIDCRSATAIRVVITTDGCARVSGTNVFVGTHESIENDQAPAASTGAGCIDKASLIGTLVVFPKDSKDAVVAVKVVSGVDGVNPDKCTALSSYDGCIVSRREVHFTPHEEVELDIPMSLACKNLSCRPDETCVVGPSGQGECVGLDKIPPPGTPSAIDGGGDGGPSDGGPPPPPPPTDAGSDVDAARVTCDPNVCKGGNFVGCGADGVCTIVCKGGANKCQGSVCPNNFNCHITCNNSGDCPPFDCTTTGTCTIDCDGQNTCQSATCRASSCAVNCNGETSCGKVRVDAGSGAILCTNAAGNPTCNDVECAGGSCQLTCQAGGCAGGQQNCCAGTCGGPFATPTGVCPRP